MKWRPLFAVLLAFAVVLPAHAQTKEALEVVPDDALAFILINNLEETDARISSLINKVKKPLQISPLALAKKALGINKGLNTKGSAVLAIFSADGPDPAAVAALPVSDYNAVAKSLGAENPKAKMSTVQVDGKETIITKKGNFLLACEAKHKTILKQVLASNTSITKSVATLRKWLDANQVSAVCTSTGVKYLTKQARDGIAMANALPNPGVKKILDMFSKNLDSLDKEVPAMATGIRVDMQDNVQVSMRAWFKEGGSFAKAGKKAKGVKEPLAMFPAGDFVFAFGGPYPKELAEFGAQMGLDVLKDQPLEAFPKEQFDKLLATQMNLAKQIRSMSMLFRPGDPVFENTFIVIGVDDAASYMKANTKMMAVTSKLYKKLFKQDVIEYREIKMNGKPGMEMTMDLTAIGGKNLGAMQVKVFEILFGKGGKMRVSAAALDNNTIMMRYASTDELKQAIKMFAQAKTKFSQDAGVKATLNMLPEGSQWVAFVSAKGIMDLGRQMAAAQGLPIQLPAFPATPPVGIGARMNVEGVEVRFAVPGAVLGAVGDYIGNFGN